MCFTEDDDEAERFIRYAKRKKETIERVSDAEAVAMVGERLHWNRNG